MNRLYSVLYILILCFNFSVSIGHSSVIYEDKDVNIEIKTGTGKYQDFRFNFGRDEQFPQWDKAEIHEWSLEYADKIEGLSFQLVNNGCSPYKKEVYCVAPLLKF